MKLIQFFSFISFWIAGICLTACTDKDIVSSVDNVLPTDINILKNYYFILDTNVPQTRVSYTDVNASYFDEGDEMGIFVIDDDNNLITSGNGNLTTANVHYKVTNVTGMDNVIRQVIEPVDGTSNRVPRGQRYLIYYPYRENMTFDYIRSLTYQVESDQNAESTSKVDLIERGLTAFEASDLLWDVVEDEQLESIEGELVNYANIRMDHVMAQIILNISENLIASAGTEGYDVYITNNPLSASSIILTTSTLGELNYISSTTIDVPIRMWNSGFATSGALQFRAVVPACRTLNENTVMFRIKMADNSEREFSIANDLVLNPGKNYIFTIQENGGTDQPELNDDDSWVLDVLDPETGEPVGLLCREYLRYQPDDERDVFTGTPDLEGNSKWINSQAWVFYNLQNDGRTPNLNKGTVLRFIYDIDPLDYGDQTSTPEADNGSQVAIWPLPHLYMRSQGLFTPRHGFRWGTVGTDGYGGEYTGHSYAINGTNVIEKQYYMHGGIITWNGIQNKIESFTMPEIQITNEQAYNGYIAIEEGKEPYVSYTEREGVKKGIIMEHYLIDTRYNRINGQAEIKRYPLVKIGYNQFWMSKPLDTEYLIDGTRIPCYNQEANANNTGGVTFPVDNTSYFLGLGYLYAFVKEDDSTKEIDGSYVSYDPYNVEEDRPSSNSSFQPAKHYNVTTVEDPRFAPISPEGNTYYIMPSKSDLVAMGNYFGPYFAAKLCTRELVNFDATKANAGVGSRFVETRKQAIIEGKTCGNTAHDPQVYCANISGFNIRAMGFYDYYRFGGVSPKGFYDVGESACMMLKREPEDGQGVRIMRFPVHDTFTTDISIFNEYPKHGDNPYNYHCATKVFAQVRLLMKYRNQADTGGSRSLHSSFTHIHPQKACNVYVPLEAME